MKFATPYTHDRERSKLFAKVNDEESKTQQSDKDDADINIIVGRFMKSGQLPQISKNPILGGDFTSGADFRDALEYVREAKAAFEEIPAKIRRIFGNSPEAFIEYAADPENLPQMRKWGLANEEKKPENAPVPDATPKANNEAKPNG